MASSKSGHYHSYTGVCLNVQKKKHWIGILGRGGSMCIVNIFCSWHYSPGLCTLDFQFVVIHRLDILILKVYFIDVTIFHYDIPFY